MDYEVMLDFHKANHADVTIATMPVSMEEASRFGIVIADENKKIQDFEEKPEKPRSRSGIHTGVDIAMYGGHRDPCRA